MTEITRVMLENEMGVAAAHKRMSTVAQLFYLTLSSQSVITTAVADISRAVVGKTDLGWLTIAVEKAHKGFVLTGSVHCPAGIDLRLSEEQLNHNRLLVPQLHIEKGKDTTAIHMSVEIPRSVRVTGTRIAEAVRLFRDLATEDERKAGLLLDQKKSEFLSVASHELKTPLTSIMAFTRLALGTNEPQGIIGQYLEKIDIQAHRLHLLIEQLLDISRIELGRQDYDMQDKEWNDYMTDLIPTLGLLVPSHHLSWTPCPTATVIRMDGLRIEQVLTNLVGNAAKYSDPGTRIDVGCSSDSSGLTVCVRDEGIGISSENAPHLFEKYFREEAVADKYSGFGIGLFIAADIIRGHKGSIRAERNEQKGSSFYFTLPVFPQ